MVEFEWHKWIVIKALMTSLFSDPQSIFYCVMTIGDNENYKFNSRLTTSANCVTLSRFWFLVIGINFRKTSAQKNYKMSRRQFLSESLVLCHWALNVRKMFKLILISALITFVNCSPGLFEKLFGPQQVEEQNGGSRIVGGQTATERVPYQISMQMRSRGGGGGGFLFFQQQPPSNWSWVDNKKFFFRVSSWIWSFQDIFAVVPSSTRTTSSQLPIVLMDSTSVECRSLLEQMIWERKAKVPVIWLTTA